MKKGFDEGVVGHLARTVHALGEPELGKALLERRARVFSTSIGVKDEPALCASATHSAVERAQGQCDVLPRPVAPAHDASAVFIHHYGEIAVDGSNLEVRDVTDPDLVRALDLEIELLIENAAEVALHSRTRVANRSHAGHDAVPSHESCNPDLAHAVAALAQGPTYP